MLLHNIAIVLPYALAYLAGFLTFAGFAWIILFMYDVASEAYEDIRDLNDLQPEYEDDLDDPNTYIHPSQR